MRKLLLPILVLAFTACNQSQMIRPAMPSTPHGLVEINFSQINDLHPSSSAKNISVSSQNRTLGDLGGGIDMKLLSTTAFTFNAGVNRENGFRYLSATFKIRNADSTGTPYTTSRNNLSFVAVSTPNTVASSAISSLLKFDGTPADPSIAPLIRPTHEMILDKYALFPIPHVGSEDFQAFSEAEIAKFQPGGTDALAGVSSVFGYGFVTRAIGETFRTLPTAPTRFLDGYDGIVTFAVRVPLQANPNGASKDPFSFSMMFEVMDDNQTTITQSLEEQNNPNYALTRSAAMNNTPIKTLPGSVYQGIPICSVRTAGTVNNPLALMVNSSNMNGTPALANNMFVTAGNSVGISFNQAMSAANYRTIAVNGSMTSLKVGSYTGAGTNNLGFFPTDISSATFPANEELEVTLSAGLNSVAGLSFCPPYTFKYRTKVNVSSNATFPNRSLIAVGDQPSAIISVDLNNDGKMDLVTTSLGFNSIVVALGNGDGTFQAGLPTSVGGYPSSLVAADFNHDHFIDFVTTNALSNNMTILLGNGTGGFWSVSTIGFSTATEFLPRSATVTDLNSDGNPDIITANSYLSGIGANSFSVFLGNGDGSFKPSIPRYFYLTTSFTSVTANDFNNDGKMDITMSDNSSTKPALIPVFLGNGDGSFQEPKFRSVHAFPIAIASSDVNNDGKVDLITAHANGNASEVGISLGYGDGSFQFPFYYPVGLDPSQVISADLNGDGTLDIATSDFNNAEIAVMLGNGNGTFQSSSYLQVGANPNSLTASDLNNDGKLDLASTSATNAAVTVLLQ
jgi:FG-GAP-like repeat